MKNDTKRRLADFPMARLMIALAVIGVIGVPTLWLSGHKIWAVVVMMTVFTMIVQAACIDLPGSPYQKIHRLWKSKGSKSDKDQDFESPG